MGVYFNDSAAYWSYDAFHDFRRKLAREIGVPLNLMDGYAEGRGIAWALFDDPLLPLLTCEDLGATFTPAQCETMAARIRQLTADWSDADEDKYKASILAMLMEGHAQFGLPLSF